MNRPLSQTFIPSPPDSRGLADALALRDYQQALISEIYHQWQSGQRNVLAQLPTGGGKTIVFGEIAREFHQHEQVLILAHRDELIRQAADKVRTICGCEVGIIKSGEDFHPDAPVQVASVQSLVNRLNWLECPGLIVIDEAHHVTAASYRKILDAYPDSYRLGVTATPARLDGGGFEDLFDSLVCGPSVSDLIEPGYLSPFLLYADSSPMQTHGARSSGGDYRSSDVARLNDAVELSGNLIASYRQHCDGKRCIVFAINVEHSEEIAARYQEAGIPAAHLDGNTPVTQRRQTLERFAAGEIQVLSNCALFTEGFDLPALDAVQIARPTQSLTMWLQMLGRALRPAAGKEYAVILDHTKNWAIHGLPSRPRLWTLEGVRDTAATQRIRPRRHPDGLIEEFEAIESDAALEAVEDDRVEQVSFAVLADLLEIQRARGYRRGWVYYQLRKLKPPLPVWQEYGRLRGYKPGWAWHKYQEQQQAEEVRA
jgi:superfamily II DNA or RNA helicase